MKSPSHRHPVVRYFASTVVALALTSLSLANPAGKTPGPNVNLDEPVLVEVQGPVDVLGAVEVVAEPVKQPFRQTQSGPIPAGQLNDFFRFDLPAGKRVIVETVTVIATISPGATAFGWLSIDALENPGIAALTFTYQGVLHGNHVYTASSPLLLRLEADKVNLRANIYRSDAAGNANVTIGIHGYLEDL